MKETTMTSKMEILKFIWKWKVSSFALVSFGFYGHPYSQYIYRKLIQFEKEKLIRFSFEEEKSGWGISLTAEGYRYIKKNLDFIYTDGYKSEAIAHDLDLSALHFWLSKILARSKVEAISEQELRCCDVVKLNPALPQLEFHRPDGYLIIGNNEELKKIIAIEYERSFKPKDDFIKASSFYNESPEISGVLWIAKDPEIAKRIKSELLSLQSDRKNIHFIFTLAEIKNRKEKSISICGESIFESVNCRGLESMYDQGTASYIDALLDQRKTTYLRDDRKTLFCPTSLMTPTPL